MDKEKLTEYNRKRNFDRTLEPEGISEMPRESLRFVVQHHLARRDHYDFRLEWDGTLLSWAVPKGPSYDTRDKRLAVHVEDHPLEYRNFEGTIPKGEYGGGVVMLWDEGYWEPHGDVAEGLGAGMLKFVLKGQRLKGKWALVRLKGKKDEKQENWLLLKEKDEHAAGSDGVSEFTTSIRTGRTMEEIEAGKEWTDGLVIQGIKISNPDKVIFTEPEITKGDVVRYYEKAAERMLPYLSRRVLSIVRCPKGISQTCFYKKHPGPGSKGIVTIPITHSEGKTEDYFYIENISGLIAEAQMGTLEFHTWGSRVDALEKPDLMVFDLDPDEGMELSHVRQGVRDLHSILTELSLNAYLKTSGGKGYHVVVPLKPTAAWEVFHDFARRVAEVMEQKWPDRYTSNVRKAKRKGKIFIDWIRNGRGATSIAPYSIRARKGARVSMPIAWAELDTLAPDSVTMAEALRRIEDKDPWDDFFRNHQQLT
ncbi:non-homologous end-joining DNA ligase [Dehalobacter sp. DCM]|uniref:non-homologous end-joining DNA ligase n=1 Tax=Dehalobacter sp. DCM TaxID=2907827 RepID=UPI0030820A81|nr:non-homologous end-joining DNA ligase [Dehalobacter sp. DCM]